MTKEKVIEYVSNCLSAKMEVDKQRSELERRYTKYRRDFADTHPNDVAKHRALRAEKLALDNWSSTLDDLQETVDEQTALIRELMDTLKEKKRIREEMLSC
jgi:flagellar biosynthesis chaperone FliJ